MIFKATPQKQSSKQSLPKVNLKSNCPEDHCGTLISNQLILGINFPKCNLIKLAIIIITYTCIESYPLSY